MPPLLAAAVLASVTGLEPPTPAGPRFSLPPQDWGLRNGNQANAAFRRFDEPAGTLPFGQRLNWVGWVKTPE